MEKAHRLCDVRSHWPRVLCVVAAEADGRPKLRPVFGLDDAAAPRELVDGPAAVARFHRPHSLLLRRDSAGQPFVLVGDQCCIRILRGRSIGGQGDDRVNTLGGPEILHENHSLTRLHGNLELQSLDSTRVLIQDETTGDHRTTYRYFTLDTTNLEQPELSPVKSNTKPDLPLGPFLHILPRKQFSKVLMLAPNLWLHVEYDRNKMTKSRVFPYFPDERRVDQTKQNGVELTWTSTADVDHKQFTVVAAKRVLTSCKSTLAQADVMPTYGQCRSDQLLPVAPRFIH